MERAGLASTSAVILLADHGEEFYDHGGTTHGRTLYQELVRVPLIAAVPGWSLDGGAGREGGAAGRVVLDRVSTLDVYPTILELAGVAPPGGIGGVSLGPFLGGPAGNGPSEGGAPRVIGTQLLHQGRSWSALYAGADKFIRGRPPAADPAAASIIELYHLDRDPGERSNAAASDPERASGLASVLDGLEKVWGIAGIGGRRPGETIDPETLRQLKALGYVH